MSSFQDRVNKSRYLKRELANQQAEEQRILDSTIPRIRGIIFTDIGERFRYNRWRDSSTFFSARQDDIDNLGHCIKWDFREAFLDWLKKERTENALEDFTDDVEEDVELKKFFLGSHSIPKSTTVKTDDNSGILLMNETAAQIFPETDFSCHSSLFSKDECGDPAVEIVSAVLNLLEQIHLHYGLSPFYREDDRSAHDIATCIVCGCPSRSENPYGININAPNISTFFGDIQTFIRQKELLEKPGTRGPFFKNSQYNGTAKQAAAYFSNEKDVELRLLNGQYGLSPDEAKKIIEQCKLRYPSIGAIAYVCAQCGTNAAEAEIFRCEHCLKEFCSNCAPVKRVFRKEKTFDKNLKTNGEYLAYGLYKCPFCGTYDSYGLAATGIGFLIEDSKMEKFEQ